MEIDRISHLPADVMDQILMRLPIKDAARTSVLSRSWKYKFAELPYLTFSRSEFLQTPESDVVRAVNHILLLHMGPILKVRLEEFKDYDALDRLIIHFSQSSTKEFEIQLRDFHCRLPSCFYAWRNLATLLCSHLSLKLPSPFPGFANLKSLELRSVRIDGADLENLIVGCPVLERLTINLCSELKNVKINAPNLKFLYFRNRVEFLSFERTICLAHVFLRNRICYRRFRSGTSHFFARLPGIQFLDVDSFSLKFVTAGVEPSKVPILCESLECLVIGANWYLQTDCLRARCLFKICPNITELTVKIVSISCKENCWRNEDYSHSMFTKLQYVEISSFNGTELESDFVKFVLLNSPVLEKMVIRPASRRFGLGLLQRLETFRGISARSRIVFFFG